MYGLSRDGRLTPEAASWNHAGVAENQLVTVLCNAPPDRAESIARAIVEQRLAACVNVIPGVVSLYWWQGEISRDEESTLLIKTRAELVAELTEAIRALHPYSVPEVVALRLEPEQGNLDYHRWVIDETRPPR
jgi:periplasmic divalent cation tolerance protein